eukprot:218265_1
MEHFDWQCSKQRETNQIENIEIQMEMMQMNGDDYMDRNHHKDNDKDKWITLKGNETYYKKSAKTRTTKQILKQTLHYLTNKSPYISNPLHIKSQSPAEFLPTIYILNI